MPSPEAATVKTPTNYKNSFPMEVCVTYSNVEAKRPYVEGKILAPIPEVFDRSGEAATTMRCYCRNDIKDGDAKLLVSNIEKGTVIQGIAHGPSTRYDGKAFGSFGEASEKPENKPTQIGILPSAVSTKQTFTVSNMPTNLVERMDQKLDDIDVKRTYFLKKLINKFLAGDFDDDFV